MKLNTTTAAFVGLLMAGALGAQTTGQSKRLVLNNQSFVVLNQNAFLVVDNPLPQGITAINGGHIISEGENNVLKWSIGPQAGFYHVPFATKGLEEVPVNVTLPASANDRHGALLFASYQDTEKAANLGNAQQTVQDRFWRVEATGAELTDAVIGLPAKESFTNAVAANNALVVFNGCKAPLESANHTWALSNAKVTGVSQALSALAKVCLFPNPFMQRATLSYELTQDVPVQADLLNEQGAVVQSLIALQQQSKGHYDLTITSELPAGAYSLRLATGATVQVLRLVKL